MKDERNYVITIHDHGPDKMPDQDKRELAKYLSRHFGNLIGDEGKMDVTVKIESSGWETIHPGPRLWTWFKNITGLSKTRYFG